MRDVEKIECYQVASNSKPSANARLIRNRQATAMLEVSLALLDVKRHAENGGSMDDLSYNLDVLAKYLRDSAF